MALTVRDIIGKIKEKKELSSLDEGFIESSILPLIKKYPGLENAGNKEIKIFIKEAREKLRLSAGMFQKNSSSKLRNKLLDEGKIEELLQTHSSTKERIADYPYLKKKLSELKIKSILDLGCGLNPLALAEPGLIYSACDINKDEISMISRYFQEKGITGNAFIFDLNSGDFSALPKSDICLLWKVLDFLGKKDIHKLKGLIDEIPCRYIWLSFSSKTLSGKPMRYAHRPWMKRLLSGLKYKYKVHQTSGELFYLIDKRPILFQ